MTITTRAKNKEELIKLIKKNEIVKEIKKRNFVDKYFKNIDKSIVTKIKKLDEESFNEVYLKTFNDRNRINIFYGGSGSGKSEYIARKHILKFALEKGHNGLFVRKYAVDVRKSIFKLLKKIISEYFYNTNEQVVKIYEGNMSFKFWNGNEILLGGLDDTEKIKSITFEHGVLTDVWFEEANQGTGEEIKELRRRLRGISEVDKHIDISFNPVSKNSWLYENYFDIHKENQKYYFEKGLTILKTTIYDNKYATQEDREELENQVEIYDKEVYLHGNFGVVSENDCIVPYNDTMICTENKDISDAGEIYIGVDCAGMGDDSTVVKVRKGAKQIDYGFEMQKAEEPEVLEKIEELIYFLQEKYKKNIDSEHVIPIITLNVDTTGVGYGVGSQLRTKIQRGQLTNAICNSVAFGGKAKDEDRYTNIVTEMYFNMRNLILTREIYIIRDSASISELTQRKFTIDPKTSRRAIEDKKTFKKRIKKSPDNADALVMAFYVPESKKVTGIYEMEW